MKCIFWNLDDTRRDDDAHFGNSQTNNLCKEGVGTMTASGLFRVMGKVCSILTILLAFYIPFTGQAHATDKVTTYKDEKGWKLQVNGRDFYVKGVVWGYIPRDETHTYNLWAEPEEFIKKVLDYDFGLMKAAGINANRSFTMIPPKWVTYIYREHGIMSVINPLMGRYGHNVGGRWVPNTNYADELTRATLKKDMLDIVDKYKNTPGVLMFAFGNESNYALAWSSFEIENLPTGEQNKEKAKYLYSLWNEIIQAGKRVDTNHPFTIVNGDLQYIDLIAEYCTDMDLLGTNMYRGTGFSDLWEKVKAKLDLPIVFMEMGSDAFNMREFTEDQEAQARYLKSQWWEMYRKSYGNGEEGNSLGGFVFEWRDEWWKNKVEDVVNLDIHDRTATWASGGYKFDYVDGKNNMNEEWWGINRLGTPNADGVYTAIPRMAYDVLSEIWRIDPYKFKKDAIDESFSDINMDYLALKSDVRMLKSESKESREIIHFAGGRIETEFVLQGYDNDIKVDGEEGVDFQDQEMLFLDFEFQPTDKISGQSSLNILGNVADKIIEVATYGNRGKPVTVISVETIDSTGVPVTVQTPVVVDGIERVEIYDFEASYEGDNYDINAFYHVPRFHWGYEGDFYGLLRETTDMIGEDIWNAKAPEGVEFVGKGSLEGLKVVGGPEIYWGANPKVMLKYENNADLPLVGNIDYAFIHSEDVDRQGTSATATSATVRQSRATTLYLAKEFPDTTKLEVGLIGSSSEKVDDLYTRLDGGQVKLDKIDDKDMFGAKVKLSFDMFDFSRAYVQAKYAGLIADGGVDQTNYFGGAVYTMLPYDAFGNKIEYDAGIQMNFGHFMIYPRVLYRENLEDANPFIPASGGGGAVSPGIAPRNTDTSPFAVLGNRGAKSAEIFLTYDPTGATNFYDWDNDLREDAGFAFNIGANYTQWTGATDAFLFFFEPTASNASFGIGLPKDEVWQVTSRMVFNPNRKLKIVTNLLAAHQQSSGTPEGGTRTFYETDAKFIINRKHIISAYVKKDAWGLYDFHEQFNVTFPLQFKLDYSILLDKKRDELRSSKVGVRALYNTLDGDSPESDYQDGLNDYLFQTQLYVRWNF